MTFVKFRSVAEDHTGNIFLYGQGVFTKRNLITARDLEARGKGTAVVAGGLTFGVCAAAVSALIAAAPFTFGISLLGIPAEIAVCAAAGIAVTAVGFASKPSTPSQPPPVRDTDTSRKVIYQKANRSLET